MDRVHAEHEPIQIERRCDRHRNDMGVTADAATEANEDFRRVVPFAYSDERIDARARLALQRLGLRLDGLPQPLEQQHALVMIDLRSGIGGCGHCAAVEQERTRPTTARQ